MVPPTNQTKLEGEKVEFTCEAKALPGNVTVRWFREGAPVQEALEKRVDIRRDGSLIVNPVSADDSGLYLCEVTNGIGEPQSASAYLSVECEYPLVTRVGFALGMTPNPSIVIFNAIICGLDMRDLLVFPSACN